MLELKVEDATLGSAVSIKLLSYNFPSWSGILSLMLKYSIGGLPYLTAYTIFHNSYLQVLSFRIVLS